MAKRVTPSAALADAAKIQQMWKENPEFSVPGLSAKDHASQQADVAAQGAEIASAKAHLAGLIEKRDGDARTLHDGNVRARRGVGFTYGLESPQYKMVGGTPPSERKPPVKKAKK